MTVRVVIFPLSVIMVLLSRCVTRLNDYGEWKVSYNGHNPS
jgi:hypothetical protein